MNTRKLDTEININSNTQNHNYIPIYEDTLSGGGIARMGSGSSTLYPTSEYQQDQDPQYTTKSNDDIESDNGEAKHGAGSSSSW